MITHHSAHNRKLISKGHAASVNERQYLESCRASSSMCESSLFCNSKIRSSSPSAPACCKAIRASLTAAIKSSRASTTTAVQVIQSVALFSGRELFERARLSALRRGGFDFGPTEALRRAHPTNRGRDHFGGCASNPPSFVIVFTAPSTAFRLSPRIPLRMTE